MDTNSNKQIYGVGVCGHMLHWPFNLNKMAHAVKDSDNIWLQLENYTSVETYDCIWIF